ncbi:hypothetical protein M8C21_020050 [Ambrosia artemisiifolia]|uniref:Uncharacterized protein n=1 Tax=Ambrosia artemisiifolia TaxID=4212 RepID=A0AAD5CZY9_AMBAR|nr:hypothetical protein M8C21_020050 [Ambrosia artemisiifolia]
MSVSGKPIKLVGHKERLEDPEPFYPYRMAGCILGMRRSFMCGEGTRTLKPGSLQHLGENKLAFLLHTVASSQLSKVKVHKAELRCDGRRWIIYGLGGDSHMRGIRRAYRDESENNALLEGDGLVFDNYKDKTPENKGTKED